MAMSIFEIQVVRDGRWIASDAFENYEAAYECAARIEQNQRPEPLRIRRIDLMTTGTMRERTMYDGGQKPRREMAVERQARNKVRLGNTLRTATSAESEPKTPPAIKMRVFLQTTPSI